MRAPSIQRCTVPCVALKVCVHVCIHASILTQTDCARVRSRARAMTALGWIAKALVMRNHAQAQRARELLLGIALAPASAADDTPSRDAKASACAALGLVLSDRRGALHAKLHARSAFLYKQKFLNAAVGPLCEASTAKGCYTDSSRESRLWAMRALCHLLCGGAPAAAVMQHAAAALPLVLECVPSLVEASSQGNDAAATKLVGMVMSLARLHVEASGAGEATPIGRVVVSQAAKLCGAALAALKCEQSSRARVGALSVLRALVECDGVPWSTLFPLRPRVCTALGVALDDDRRSVRQAAVAAKDSWEANR